MKQNEIFQNLAEADIFIQNFFRSENLKRFFESIYRNIKQLLPPAVIRGKDKEILGIAPAECKYLF